MKKLLFIAFAATAIITGCSKDEIVEQSTPKAIGFSEAFIDNNIGARTVDPSYTLDGAGETTKLDAFQVYGFNNDYTTMLFDGTVVSGGTGNWAYSPVKYWRKGLYSFVAIAPSSSKNVSVIKEENLGPAVNTPNLLIKAINFTNESGTEDLIHATAVVDNTTNINTAPVNFTFNHLLSKIKFNVTNGFGTGTGYSLKVTHVTISAPSEGAYDTQSGTWNSTNVKMGDYIFGSTIDLAEGASADCGFEKLFIPKKDGVYKVSFKVESTFNGVTTVYSHMIEDVKLANFEPGNCYNIKITINSNNIDPDKVFDEIVFNVEGINSWTPMNGTDIPFDPTVI